MSTLYFVDHILGLLLYFIVVRNLIFSLDNLFHFYILFIFFRRRVIASLQSVIMYEYLPSFLGQELSPFSGYKPDTHPGISHVFQSAAFRSEENLSFRGSSFVTKKMC